MLLLESAGENLSDVLKPSLGVYKRNTMYHRTPIVEIDSVHHCQLPHMRILDLCCRNLERCSLIFYTRKCLLYQQYFVVVQCMLIDINDPVQIMCVSV